MIHDLNISLEDLRLFYQVVSNGGYLKASKAVNICQAKASRRVAHIERVLGVQLLHCNMRELTLTAAGREVFEMAEIVLSCTNKTFTSVKTNQESMEGEITLFATTAFGGFCMTPWIAEFLEMYPLVRIKALGKDFGDPDLMMGESDISVSSAKPLARESLHAQLLCEYPLHIYASKKYLDKFGRPSKVQDLDDHKIIAWNEPLPDHSPAQVVNALLYVGREPSHPRKPYSIVSTDVGIVTHAAQGFGLALMPEFLATPLHGLERVFLEEEDVLIKKFNKKFVSYPKVLRNSKRHKELIDFLIQKAEEHFPRINPTLGDTEMGQNLKTA